MRYKINNNIVTKYGLLKLSIHIKKLPIRFGHALSMARPDQPESTTGIEIRKITYQKGSSLENFPLLLCAKNIETCLDLNLFLQHKYTGAFNHDIDRTHYSLTTDVSLQTISSIANSLRVFLQWLCVNGWHWKDNCNEEIIANTIWLPTYAFRAHLIDEVKADRLALTTANLYIGHIVQFYYWAYLNNKITVRPFNFSKVPLRKGYASSTSDLLFGFTPSQAGHEVLTHDLRIPQKYRAKTKAFDSDLCPYSQEELIQLLSAPSVQSSPNKRLWIQLGFRCGLRAAEVASLNAQDFRRSTSKSFSEVLITGKGGKVRKAYIPFDLVAQINDFKNSHEQLRRKQKWEQRSLNEEEPLFINRSGKRIQSASISNLIHHVRKPLISQGVTFKRSFHDLRSTFATGIAKYMVIQGHDHGLISYKLTTLLGHANFDTSRKYINLAKEITAGPILSGWEKDIFGNLDTLQDTGKEQP